MDIISNGEAYALNTTLKQPSIRRTIGELCAKQSASLPTAVFYSCFTPAFLFPERPDTILLLPFDSHLRC